jgi:membrane protein DedA with SNARE-associated domain
MDINSLIPFFSNYGIFILLLSGILGGEEVIISLVFLSAMGLFPLWWILVFVTLGEFISDFTIFSLGRLNLFHKFKKIERFTRLYEKADRFIIKVSKESTFLTLLYSKFIYGTRIFTLVYLSSKKTQWRKFIISESLVLIVWMSITVAVGWFAGASVKQLSLTFKKVEFTLLLLLIFIIFIVMVKKWIQTKLLKKQKRLN